MSKTPASLELSHTHSHNSTTVKPADFHPIEFARKVDARVEGRPGGPVYYRRYCLCPGVLALVHDRYCVRARCRVRVRVRVRGCGLGARVSVE